jgi:flagellar motility protein MotE (MotC chaperone)
MTDRLSLANALAEAKIDRPAAERIATEIFDAIHDNVATKSDLQAARTELKTDIAAVQRDLRELELRLKSEIDRVVIRLGALVLTLTGVILAAIRYLPPAH